MINGTEVSCWTPLTVDTLYTYHKNNVMQTQTDITLQKLFKTSRIVQIHKKYKLTLLETMLLILSL